MELSKFIETGRAGEKTEFSGRCHDCGRAVEIIASITGEKTADITGGAVYETPAGTFFKCGPCFEEQKKLLNYQPCEVYSRIVGYLRPVGQWNKGKQSEYEQRKVLSV